MQPRQSKSVFYTGRYSLTDAFTFAIAISMGTTKLTTNAPWQKIRTLSSIELCHNPGKLRFIHRFVRDFPSVAGCHDDLLLQVDIGFVWACCTVPRSSVALRSSNCIYDDFKK